ncbi:MAG: aminopeptidase [Thermodesulfobacteriota bacterium]|nr:aminopeptidase [Thermodesulfobacteriota bacterium]
MDEERMVQVAQKVVGQVLALRPGETVCILRDGEDSGPFAATISQVALMAGAEPVSLIIVAQTVGGQELPDPVAGAFIRSSAIINLARWPIVHSRAVSAALGAGARSCNLRGFQDGVLESPGVTTDYEVVRRNALAMDVLLEQAREVRFTTAEGSDVTMQLGGRKGKAQTGFADEPGRFSGLPDGESTVAPLEGTTQGCIVNPYIIDKIGQVDEPFRMEIKDGWIVNVDGGKQAQQLLDLFEKSDSNARRFASQFALGMNPDCRVIPNAREVSKKLGTLHVAMGDNISLGGTIQCGLHIDIVILNPTVWLDGKIVLENGNLSI